MIDLSIPRISQLAMTGENERFIVTRTIENAEGELETQALDIQGNWVARPHDFTADRAVILQSERQEPINWAEVRDMFEDFTDKSDGFGDGYIPLKPRIEGADAIVD